jgi:exosortase/archaeosortase family protein
MYGVAARMAGFLGAFAIQQLVWQGLRGSLVEQWVIHWGTVRPAALWITLLTPAAHVQAVGFSLLAPGGGLNILNGCEGLEVLFLLSAAFLVVPLPIGLRVRGLLLGVLVVFVVNQLRILTLFYAYRTDPALFDPLHGTVTPIAVVLVVAAYFYAWLLHARRVAVPA